MKGLGYAGALNQESIARCNKANDHLEREVEIRKVQCLLADTTLLFLIQFLECENEAFTSTERIYDYSCCKQAD